MAGFFGYRRGRLAAVAIVAGFSAVGLAIGALAMPSPSITEFSVPNGGPAGIALGPDGNIWFTEYDASKIARITPSGTITEFSLSASSGPADIASGPDGNLWFTESVEAPMETSGSRSTRAARSGGLHLPKPSPNSRSPRARASTTSRRGLTATCGSPSTQQSKSGGLLPRAPSPSSLCLPRAVVPTESP